MSQKVEEIIRFVSSLNSKTLKLSRKPAKIKHNKIFEERRSLYQALLTPDRILNNIDTLQIGDEHHAFMGAMGYPGSLAHNWLGTIVDNVETTLNFSQFITPIETNVAVTKIQRHINDLETEILLNAKSNKITPQTTHEKLLSAKDRMRTMSRGTEKSFKIANYFSVHSTDKRILARELTSLKSTIDGLMIIPRRLYLRSLSGHKCMMPIACDDIEMTRDMDTTAGSRTIALPGRARIEGGVEGTIIGTEFATGLPIVYNRFANSNKNANLLLLAKSGAGKTFWTSLDIAHQVEIGNDVVIFDPKPDYIELVEELGGINIHITKQSDTGMNPFVLGTGPADTLTSKIVEIPAFIGMVVGGVTSAAESGLLTCVEAIYNDRGILADDSSTWGLEPPTMAELYEKLIQYINGKLPTDVPLQQADIISATALLKHLEPSCKGAYKNFFSNSTTVDLSAKLINYDISAVPEGIRDAIMYLLLSNTYDYMTAKDRGLRSVYLEEAWKLLSGNSEHIRNMVKLCRHFGMCIVLITQDLVDVTGSSAGNAIIGNCDTKIVLSIDVAYAETVGKMVGLTTSESATLPSSGKGEGYIIVGGTAMRFKTPSSLLEKKLIEKGTTQNSVSERFDTSGDFYPRKGLSSQQIRTLSGMGFDLISGKRLGPGSADYMVRNQAKNQGSEHFIMTHLIKQAADELGLDSEIHDYGLDFDITVKNSYGFPIGFEYETGSNNWSDVLDKADRLNESSKHSGAKEWYFVVPSKLKDKYAEVNGNTITGGQIKSLLRNFAAMEPNIVAETEEQLNKE